MAHKKHKQFDEAVFTELCNNSLKELSETVKASQVDWETKQVAFLEYLLKKVQEFCGVEEGFRFEDLTGYPQSVQIKQKIIGIVDFDSVHEHPTMVFFYKQPIIEEYIKKAIGEKPE
jgi:hypothetical protein